MQHILKVLRDLQLVKLNRAGLVGVELGIGPSHRRYLDNTVLATTSFVNCSDSRKA
jgi:hypothetical protein